MWCPPQVAVIGFLEGLVNAHRQPSDHTQLLAQLTQVIHGEKRLATSYAHHIADYLISNLQNNMQVLPTMECLCLAHELLSAAARSEVSRVLVGKYRVGDYWEQLRRLEAVSSSLVQPFLRLARCLAQWFSQQIEVDYQSVGEQVGYLLSYLVLIGRYEWEKDLSIQMQAEEYILVLYHLFASNPSLLQHQPIRQQLIQGLFYFLSNYQPQMDSISSQSSVMHVTVGELLAEMRRHCQVEEQLMKFTIVKVNNWKGEDLAMMDIACRLAVNSLVADWSMQRQFFWLRSLQTVGQLLALPLPSITANIHSAQQLVRELIKLFKNL